MNSVFRTAMSLVPLNRIDFAIYVGTVIGSVYTFIHFMEKPRINLDCRGGPGGAEMSFRRNIGSMEKVTHQNIDCLTKKGYSIKKSSDYSYVKNYEVWKKKGGFSMDEFYNDCKECDVHSVADYSYESVLTGKRKKGYKMLWWDDACKEEMR